MRGWRKVVSVGIGGGQEREDERVVFTSGGRRGLEFLIPRHFVSLVHVTRGVCIYEFLKD